MAGFAVGAAFAAEQRAHLRHVEPRSGAVDHRDGLSSDEQQQSGFRYDYSVYQVEYSRNLVFASGAVMDRLFN